MKGIIVGAGIGGLTTAIALESRGIEYQIFEAAPELSVKGAGILIPPNAMAVLAQYNLVEALKPFAQPIQSMVIMNANGEVLSSSSTNYAYHGKRFQTHAIHRGELQKLLLNKLNNKQINLGHKCDNLNFNGNKVEVCFDHQAKISADFVIGADGLRSKVRRSLFSRDSVEPSLRYSGQICWRGVANIELDEKWRTQLTEIWGQGTRFGFVKIAPEQVYWYATQHQKSPLEQSVDFPSVISQFENYPSPVQAIIESTLPNQIIQDPIYDLSPLSNWSDRNVVLMGDAAHASTPNLGQGGAQAIEDAHLLAKTLSMAMTQQQAAEAAFKIFEKARRKKVDNLVKTAWQIGQVTNLSNPVACYMRNTAVKHMSKFMMKKSTQQMYAWP
ncbi:MAG: FAD-dependent monooxygenase [Marinomonas sp.]